MGHDILDDGRFTGSLEAGDKNIVAGALHVEAEIDRLHGAFLTDNGVERRHLGSVVKAKDFRVTSLFQLVGMKPPFVLHKRNITFFLEVVLKTQIL